MKKFWEMSKSPLIIACIASILYIVDALIGGLIRPNASFMWVAFAIWTIFFGAKLKDRIKALIGVIIGFGAAVVMMLITSSFNVNLHTMSISCLIGVFVVNFAVMYFEKAEKAWLNSISGIFAGIFLTFSGLGCGFNPLASVGEAFTMLGTIVLYTVLGLVCGFFSIFFMNKFKKKEINEDVKKESGKSEGQEKETKGENENA